MIAAALLAARALLGRIPGVVWGIALCIVVLVGGAFAAVRLGERRGAVQVERTTVGQAVTHVLAQRDTARAKSDVVLKVAAKAKVASDTGRATTRAILAAHLDETPPEVVQAVNQQLERDSVAIALPWAATSALLAERPVDDSLDRLRVRQVAIGAPAAASHWKRNTAIVLGVVTAVVVVPKAGQALLTLFHIRR